MRKTKLTKTEVDKLVPPEKGQVLFWDSELPGFGIRVTPSAKVYVVQARVGGKTRRIKIGRHGPFTPEQARTEAKKLLGTMAGGVDPNAVKAEKKARAVTLRELWDEYRRARQLRPKTLQVYESALTRCFPDWLDRSFLSITKDAVQQRHEELSNTKGTRSNEGGAKAQANQAMRVLRSLLNYAGAAYEDSDGRSLLPENPVRRLSQARCWNENKRRKSVIDKSQLKPWYEAVMFLQNDTTRDFLLLCLFTGLRRNEAAALKWADVNLEDKYLRIQEERSKNHEEHLLPLTDYLVALLSERLKTYSQSPYVFPSAKDLSKHIVECKFSVKRVKDLSGVDFMVHDLRRTFITIAERLGTPHYTLKRLANHRTNDDVTAGYIVSNVESLREPMQRISDFILREVEGKKRPGRKIGTRTKRVTGGHTELEAVK